MGNILPFIGTLKGAFIGGALIGIVFMGIGWRAHQVLVAAKEAKTLQAKIDIEKSLRQEAGAQAAILSGELDTALKNVQVKYRTIIREVPGVVPKSPNCDLGPDFISVFNNAALGGVPSNTPAISYDQMSEEPIDLARGH